MRFCIAISHTDVTNNMIYTRLLVTGHLHHIDNVNEEQKTDSMYKGTMTLLAHFNIHFDHVVVVVVID